MEAKLRAAEAEVRRLSEAFEAAKSEAESCSTCAEAAGKREAAAVKELAAARLQVRGGA